jgi:hypothetical protein
LFTTGSGLRPARLNFKDFFNFRFNGLLFGLPIAGPTSMMFLYVAIVVCVILGFPNARVGNNQADLEVRWRLSKIIQVKQAKPGEE